MQMTEFGSTDHLYPPSAANNWYPTQFSSIGNNFTGFNSNLNNITGSPGHQLNPLNQLHHSVSLDSSSTNAVLQNSPPNSASPQQVHQQNSVGNSQLTNLTNNGLPSLVQTTTQSNHSTQLLSPIQAAAQVQQSRSNTTSLNLSTSSNSTSTNSSNNTLPSYSSQLGNNGPNSVAAHLHYPTHQFNLPSHSQFSPHSLSAHHSHHTLNQLTAHHHFLNNNYFPVHHTANVVSGQSSFNTPSSPSSPNNVSINSTTNAFNSLTFRPDVTSNATGNNTMYKKENTSSHHQLNMTGYDRMHPSYLFTENSSLGRSYSSLMDHSSRTSGLDSFAGLRHMPTLSNLTSNCNPGNSSINNLEETNVNVNSMFIAHHNQSLMAAGHLNHHSTSNMNNQASSNSLTNLMPLHGSAHNGSVNSSSDSRHGEEDLTLNCVKQEEDDDKLILTNQFTNGALEHPMPYNWVKKTNHNSQSQAGNKTRTRDKYRVVYTDNQRMELEKEFLFSKYITIRRKTELAQALNLSERQVKIWYQNRRAKSRRLLKKGSDGESNLNAHMH